MTTSYNDYRDKKRHLDCFFSTDFNVFKVIQPEEKHLSAIIANLLNPAGSHGQHRIFLDAFLARIERYDLLTEEPRSVTCEAPTDCIENSNRRIDIFVDFKNFGLGIENKPWALDKEKQLKDYSDHLKKKYKNKYCIVYLTKDGSDPDEKSTKYSQRERLKSERKLVCVSYSHDILEWVRECYQLCESDKFRWYLGDFMDYMLDAFPHSRYQKWGCEIIKYRFLNKLKERFICPNGSPEASQWHINGGLLEDPCNNTHNHFSLIKNSWRDRYGVGFQPWDNCIGVWKSPDVKSVPRLKQILDTKIMDGKKDKDWEWWHKLESPYDNLLSKAALIKMYTGEAVEDFAEHLKRIIDIAERIIDKHIRGSSS